MTAASDETPVVLNDTVDEGKIIYVEISGFALGSYEINLTSTTDTDLYIYDSDGRVLRDDVWAVGAPTDETGLINTTAGMTRYAGIYGAGASALPPD